MSRLLVVAIWTALVWGAYLLIGQFGALLQPVADWLASSPEIAAWVMPLAGILGALGTTLAVIVWLVGLVVIVIGMALFGRASRRYRQDRYDDDRWRADDYRPARRRRFDDDDDDDDEDNDRRRRRRRRGDDDDDDD